MKWRFGLLMYFVFAIGSCVPVKSTGDVREAVYRYQITHSHFDVYFLDDMETQIIKRLVHEGIPVKPKSASTLDKNMNVVDRQVGTKGPIITIENIHAKRFLKKVIVRLVEDLGPEGKKGLRFHPEKGKWRMVGAKNCDGVHYVKDSLAKGIGAFLITLNLGALHVKADSPAPLSFTHASLKAYPDAKISIKDSGTGITVYVESNGRSMVGMSKDGRAIWITEVIKEDTRCMGVPVIRHIEIVKNKINVTFCKHSYGEINLHTGEYKFLGSD